MANGDALFELLNHLDANGYDFVAPTPATHCRLIDRRPCARPGDLRDVFGWSLPFETLDETLISLMRAAGVLRDAGEGRRRAGVRVSRLHGRLHVHSAFPTDEEDSVFLGPDSYRFADFIRLEIGEGARRVVDLGAGAGVGGLVAAAMLPDARVTLTDVNPRALALARVNARHAGVAVDLVQGEGLVAVKGPVDLLLANPPYMVDPEARTYRDGGGALGSQVSIDWTRQGLERLEPGGRVLLYTGSAIVDGRDGLRSALEALPGAAVRYREIDPDVFGEELEKPAYRTVERIAAIGAVITRL